MAIPTTNNQTPLFVTQRPAWETGVTLEQVMPGDVQVSRSGLEQRQQRSARGQWKISYTAFLSKAQRKARGIRARAEITALCWVPFWTEQGQTASSIVAETLSIDRAWSVDFFNPGDWMFFSHPTLGDQFRQIESIGVTDQELILYELDGAIAFPAGTVIYPCRPCTRDNGNAEFTEASEDTHTERLTYQTL